MRTIELTQGKVAIVDDNDYALLSNHRWCFHGKGYACSRIADRLVLMHVFLLGKKKGLEVDHINQNKLDNRRGNLRHVTRSVNMFNVGLRSTNKSGFKGVSWDKRRGKWRATIKLNYKQIFNVSFLNKQDAVIARQEAFKHLLI